MRRAIPGRHVLPIALAALLWVPAAHADEGGGGAGGGGGESVSTPLPAGTGGTALARSEANLAAFFAGRPAGGGEGACGLDRVFAALRQEARGLDGVFVDVQPRDVRVAGTRLDVDTAVTVQLPTGETIASTVPVSLDLDRIAREAGLTRGGRRVGASRVVAERPDAVAAAVANQLGAAIDSQVRPRVEAAAAAGAAGDQASYRKAVASLGGLATSFRQKRSGDFRLAAGQVGALSW